MRARRLLPHAILGCAFATAALIVGTGVARADYPSTAHREPTVEDRLRAELRKARHQVQGLKIQRRDADRRGYRRAQRQILTTPDAERAMKLAGLAYGQDWRALKRCALSEGYRNAERFDGTNARLNRTGSGATGAWQFMPGTFRSTPQGKAGLSIYSMSAQAHAAAWMFANGRRGEWAGAGC